MKITYLETLDNKKLFSFHRHDYRDYTDDKGNYYAIDGGFDYNKVSHPNIGKEGPDYLLEAEISEVIEDIRDQFIWGQNYDKNNNKLPETIYKPLKELTTDHIIGILKYFIVKLKENSAIDKAWKITQLIFMEELLYRSKNNIL